MQNHLLELWDIRAIKRQYTRVSYIIIKRAQSYIFNLFSYFWRMSYHKEAHIFFITHGKFYSWKVFPNCNIQNCLVHPKGMTVSTEIGIFGVMILQMKQKINLKKDRAPSN